MRIYKFRGFHADENGKTVIKLDGKEIRGFWCYGDLHTDGPYINEHKVIPETVGQYVFSDKNGEEIFEGDIIINSEEQKWQVIFGKKRLSWEARNKYGYKTPLCHIAYSAFVISILLVAKIGNIYEAPELLEVEI